jgi:transcriptional regulator with XRE-family HTH domain
MNQTLDQLKADLAFNLKSIRNQRGLAQERLALEAEVDRTVVSKIERAVTNPSLDILLRLANRLDVEVSVLLQPQESETSKTTADDLLNSKG